MPYIHCYVALLIMNNELLNKVGRIVASEIHGLSTWDGDTNTFYVKTNTDPKKLNFYNLKKHIIEISEYKFEGSFWIVAFNATQRMVVWCRSGFTSTNL